MNPFKPGDKVYHIRMPAHQVGIIVGSHHGMWYVKWDNGETYLFSEFNLRFIDGGYENVLI